MRARPSSCKPYGRVLFRRDLITSSKWLNDPINAPSTLPPVLGLPGPEQLKDANSLRKLIMKGKAYAIFYKTGIQQLWGNWREMRRIESQLELVNPNQRVQELNRAQYQLLRRTRADARRAPFFVLIALVFGEFTPLLVPFIGGLIPGTCVLPQTIRAKRDQLAAFKKRALEVDPRLAVHERDLSDLEMDQPQLALLCRSRDLLSRYIANPFYPVSVLRYRLEAHEQYLKEDDGLIRRFGGVSKLHDAELERAVMERGRFTPSSRKAMAASLEGWLGVRAEELSSKKANKAFHAQTRNRDGNQGASATRKFSSATRFNYDAENDAARFHLQLKEDSFPESLYRRSWFPGHMSGALRQIRENSSRTNLLIELRDARLPISSRLLALDQNSLGLGKIVVYNKADLVEGFDLEFIKSWNRLQDVYLYSKGNTQILSEIHKKIQDYAKSKADPLGFNVLVAGMPNVGKSVFMNDLLNVSNQRGTVAKTGSHPGVTRNFSGMVRVHDQPLIFVSDSPGILMPYVSSSNLFFKFALTHAIKQNALEVEMTAKFLLNVLNQRRQYNYVDYWRLARPSENAQGVLEAIAKRNGLLQSGGRPDMRKACLRFIDKYRDGALGKFCLEGFDEQTLDTWCVEQQAESINQFRKQGKQESRAKRSNWKRTQMACA